ncbi:TFIIB-type zinc ribbon-containing protein [Haloarcula sp. CBA1130]|uniref:DUF7117 family protein n=1 Tax=unclassified Haloarcula TaxID=2624677 RepID=UPI0012470CA3|nr:MULTISPECIES: TFIIB-type zinc ribbon-containing protein [unclassified Haloarcula]KAA9397825.1 TFIIB-type zinc ribbon-containing protein [Haloarcula sp. CBA1129]KAA9402486.1 TFIIB-type zinc ribbon-containing protein [Haloarcula sp. CBA1130]
MKVRGERECQDCGTRWRYYETGSIACPDCGSIHSVGIDEHTEHTDTPATLDLTPVRNRIDADSTREIADAVAERCREYTRKRGFIDAGELRSLDPTFVAAVELQHVGTHLSRELRSGDSAERYFYELLGGADDGDRPAVEDVPSALRVPYGLAMAAAVDSYQRDVRTYLDANPEPTARQLSGRIRDHRKRIEALDGNVDPADANRLAHAARDLGSYITGDESAFVRAENWLAGIEDDTV